MSEKQFKEPGILTDNKLHLTLPPGPNGTRNRVLKFKMNENNITMVVDYGIFNDRSQRPVTSETPLDPIIFACYLELLEIAIKGKGACSWEMENWGKAWRWNKEQGKSIRDTESSVLSKVSIGKHENGVVFFAVAVKGKDTLEFKFTPNEWLRILQDGNTVPDGFSSMVVASSWTKTMRDVHNQLYVKDWKEPEHKRKFRQEQAAKRGQGGGGYNGGGGGQQQSRPPQQQPQTGNSYGQDDFDSDIPF